ncbi:hypothetical protein Rhopal_005334-T1 [Rhodotorula paludigena]|uniref:Autophagy protein 5 n=1 Tax=Rhodotorula paludigena TaxID=86838 RepID=A0AAV5GP97_9BASI|nr:hypothetical protein Rhopal_005334-T1 [Rhodotorula paludigena]
MAEETWGTEDARAQGPWSDVMHVLYEVERYNALEEHDSVRPCVLRGKLLDGEPDSAHIVGPDNKNGAEQVSRELHLFLATPLKLNYRADPSSIRSIILPSRMSFRLTLAITCPPIASRVIATALHAASNQHSLSFQPSLEAVLARLVSEYQYQAARQASLDENGEANQTAALREGSVKRARRSEPASQLPVRPPFDLFYDRLERDLAILLPTFTPEFALPEYLYYSPHDEEPSATRVRPVLNRFEPSPDATAVAPFLAPVSTNLVIFAMRLRIRQYEPAPLDQQRASQVLANAVGLLDRFWHLSDAHADEVPLLLEETLAFVATLPSSSPYVPFFRSPASANFDHSLVPLPVIPAGSRSTLGTTPGNRAALDWLSSGGESEPGLTPSEVSGLSCSSDDSDSELSRLPPGSSATSQRMRQQPSTSSFASPAAETATASASAAIFRTLVFAGSVPIEVVLADSELPAAADRSIEAYYLQAPRIGYLPLVLAQVRKYFLDLVLDDNSAASLRSDDLWFEADGVPLKWHWPIGLLYDYYHLASFPSLLPPPPPHSSAASSDPSALPSNLASVFAPLSSSSVGSTATDLSFPGALPSSYTDSAHSTLRAPSTSSSTAPPRPRTPSPAEKPRDPAQPWRVTLHLRDPPADKLLVSNRVEDARVGFMAMVKEADYVRSGSTKRVTNLRKEQQDNLWEGIVQNDFDKYWTVASKLIPLPAPLSHSSSPTSTRSPTPSSVDGRLPDANNVRSVPLRVYLPEGAPVVQDVVSPLQLDGAPTTLYQVLSALLPPLFPPTPAPPAAPPLAHALIQGIYVPLDSALGWLGACMPGADGWVSVVIVLDERADEGAQGR